MDKNPSDEPFEAALRDHFVQELDPQRGRALAAFGRTAAPQPIGRGKGWVACRWRPIAGMALVLAAAIVVVVVLRQSAQPLAMPGPRPEKGQDLPFEPPVPPNHAVADSPEPAAESLEPSSHVSSETPQARQIEAATASQAQPPAMKKSKREGKIVVEEDAHRLHDTKIIDVDSDNPMGALRRQPLKNRGSRLMPPERQK